MSKLGLVLIVFLLFSCSSESEKEKEFWESAREGFLVDDLFYYAVKSGIGEEYVMKFKVSKEILENPYIIEPYKLEDIKKSITLKEYFVKIFPIMKERVYSYTNRNASFKPLSNGLGYIRKGVSGLEIYMPVEMQDYSGQYRIGYTVFSVFVDGGNEVVYSVDDTNSNYFLYEND